MLRSVQAASGLSALGKLKTPVARAVRQYSASPTPTENTPTFSASPTPTENTPAFSASPTPTEDTPTQLHPPPPPAAASPPSSINESQRPTSTGPTPRDRFTKLNLTDNRYVAWLATLEIRGAFELGQQVTTVLLQHHPRDPSSSLNRPSVVMELAAYGLYAAKTSCSLARTALSLTTKRKAVFYLISAVRLAECVEARLALDPPPDRSAVKEALRWDCHHVLYRFRKRRTRLDPFAKNPWLNPST